METRLSCHRKKLISLYLLGLRGETSQPQIYLIMKGYLHHHSEQMIGRGKRSMKDSLKGLKDVLYDLRSDQCITIVFLGFLCACRLLY